MNAATMRLHTILWPSLYDSHRHLQPSRMLCTSWCTSRRVCDHTLHRQSRLSSLST